MPRAGLRVGACRPRAGRGGRARRHPTITVATDAKAFLKAANERLLGGPCSTRSGSRPARRTTARTARPGRRRRSSIAALGRAGRPPRSDDRDAAARPAGRRDPDHRRGQLRRLGRSRLPLPSSGDLPRPDLGRDGLRAAGRDRRRARPSRSAGRRPRRRWRPGDDDGRARDGCPGRRPGRGRRLRQRALRDDPDVAGAARDRGRGRQRARADRLRGDRASLRGAWRAGRARRRVRAGTSRGARRGSCRRSSS